ncbi:MAG: nucleotidyltransferase family protein [Rubrivivax sp.]
MSSPPGGDLLTPLWTAAAAPALSGRQWEQLLSQARRAKLLARLGLFVAGRGWAGGVPAGAQVQFDNALKHIRRLHDQTQWELDRIGHALAALPGPVVLLKGAAYVAAGLPPAPGRLFNDIDLMVPREQIRAAEQALFAAGWVAARLDPYDERYYRDLMHEIPPLEHVERRTTLDLHHAITPPTSRFAVDSRLLFERVRPVAGFPRLSVLDPADMALHAVAHLLQDGDFSGGLRDLLDVADLLVHFGDDSGFWPQLIQRSRQLGLETPLFQALTQIRRLFGVAWPAAVATDVEALAPAWPRCTAMDLLLHLALRPDHPAADGPATALARWLLYVRSHWLRMPWYQILPHLARKAWMRSRGPGAAAAAANKADDGRP